MHFTYLYKVSRYDKVFYYWYKVFHIVFNLCCFNNVFIIISNSQYIPFSIHPIFIDLLRFLNVFIRLKLLVISSFTNLSFHLRFLSLFSLAPIIAHHLPYLPFTSIINISLHQLLDTPWLLWAAQSTRKGSMLCRRPSLITFWVHPLRHPQHVIHRPLPSRLTLPHNSPLLSPTLPHLLSLPCLSRLPHHFNTTVLLSQQSSIGFLHYTLSLAVYIALSSSPRFHLSTLWWHPYHSRPSCSFFFVPLYLQYLLSSL